MTKTTGRPSVVLRARSHREASHSGDRHDQVSPHPPQAVPTCPDLSRVPQGEDCRFVGRNEGVFPSLRHLSNSSRCGGVVDPANRIAGQVKAPFHQTTLPTLSPKNSLIMPCKIFTRGSVHPVLRRAHRLTVVFIVIPTVFKFLSDSSANLDF